MILLWAFRGGFGGYGGAESAAIQGAMTRSDLYEGLESQNISAQVSGVREAVCNMNSVIMQGNSDLAREISAGFGALNTNVLLGNAQTDGKIAQVDYNNQLGVCSINRNIDAVRAENAQNTCAITTAIHCEGEATRALITQNEIQQLRTDLQAAQLTLANAAQTQNILNTMGRFVPYPGCGGNCGCNSW